MIKSFDGKTPMIAPTAFVSETACVIGDVEIGEHSSIWHGAVVRGDWGRIVIGKYTQIEDNAVIHGKVNVGDHVVVGHCAVVEGLKIGNYVLIGNGATILFDAEIGDYCIIGANAMVSAGMKIPTRSLVVGMPAKIKGEIDSEREAKIKSFLYPSELIEKNRKGDNIQNNIKSL